MVRQVRHCATSWVLHRATVVVQHVQHSLTLCDVDLHGHGLTQCNIARYGWKLCNKMRHVRHGDGLTLEDGRDPTWFEMMRRRGETERWSNIVRHGLA